MITSYLQKNKHISIMGSMDKKNENKASIDGNNNFLVQDFMFTLQDSVSGETLDILNIKNIHNVLQNISDKSNQCKIISIIILCLAFCILQLNLNGTYEFAFLLMPVILFWYLDGQYLALERVYRLLSIKVLNELQQKKKLAGEEPINYDLSRVFRERHIRLNVFENMFVVSLMRFYGLQLFFVLGYLFLSRLTDITS